MRHREIIHKKCKICDKIFSIHFCRKQTAKYCSNICRYKAIKIIFKKTTSIICEVCNKKFFISPHGKSRRKHCSLKCYWKHLKKYIPTIKGKTKIDYPNLAWNPKRKNNWSK